jgi:hypothetical protein
MRRKSARAPVARFAAEQLERRTMLADGIGPLATMTVRDVTAAGAATHELTVVYQTPEGVDVSTVGPDDVIVTNPGGVPLAVLGVSLNPSSGSPQELTAVYSLAAPGGLFDASDNGTYTAALRAGGVADAEGDLCPPASIDFAVNVPETPDVLPPAS